MMLLRRTSVTSGAMALALTGLLGWANLGVAQQPPVIKPVPATQAPAGQLSVGAAVGDNTGLIALPIRAAADGTGKGTLCGKLILGNAGVANKSVYLVEGGKVIAVT